MALSRGRIAPAEVRHRRSNAPCFSLSLSLSLSLSFFARSAPILLFIQCDAFSHAWSVSSVYLTRSVLTPKRPGVGEGLQLPLGDPLPPRACAAQFCASQRAA